jgi:hypothetical protein
MNPSAAKSFLGAGVIVLSTVLVPLAVQAQSTNTTIQNGRININQTYQQGASNTNATSQTGLININRTIQLGGNTGNPTGSFGRFTPPGTVPGRVFQGVSSNRGDDAHGYARPDRAQRRDEGRQGHAHHADRQ